MTTVTTRRETWEEVATDQEWNLVIDFEDEIANQWGNSMRAFNEVALKHGVPVYVVHEAMARYEEVMY